jgi:hypothetical protein
LEGAWPRAIDIELGLYVMTARRVPRQAVAHVLTTAVLVAGDTVMAPALNLRLSADNQMKSKIDAAIETLKSQGHSVRPYNRDGQFWYEIDGRMLVSHQEMEDLANRVNLLFELQDLFVRRGKEEQSN